MRFIHTADWHLGRMLHGVRLTEDQSYTLDRFVDLVRDVHPDAILISGDLYDRSVPPPDAIDLLDETLCRIVLGLRVPIIIISGNHDGPSWVDFGPRLL